MITLLIESFNDQLPKLPEAVVLMNGMASNETAFIPQLRRSSDGHFGLLPDEVATGSVAFVHRYLRNSEIKLNYLDYPESLHPWFARNIKQVKLRDIKPEEKCFIKPVVTKQFEAKENRYFSPALRNEFIDSMVWKSDVVHFDAEYRVFVHNNDAIGFSFYKGNPEATPNWKIIRDMMAAYKDSPIAYGLDVGVIQTKLRTNTVLIEVNDFPALGAYSIYPDLYADAYLDRWAEILARGYV